MYTLTTKLQKSLCWWWLYGMDSGNIGRPEADNGDGIGAEKLNKFVSTMF